MILCCGDKKNGTYRQAAAQAVTVFPSRGVEERRLCAVHMDRRIFMRWNFHHIEIIRQCYVPGHTAYGKAFRRPPLCISRIRYKEWRIKPEEPPPVRAVLQSRSLNAYQAADTSQSCEIGRFFYFSGHCLRCRSPPGQYALSCSFHLSA